jgi:ferredoxin-NADP reductase
MSSSRPLYKARIERTFDHATDTRSLFIRILDAPGFRFTPGQFISISIPLPTEMRVRPYSLASSPEDGQPMEICFNRVPGGVGVDYLFHRQPGDELAFTGPFGAFTIDQPPPVETIFVAVATSIAPIRPMLRRAMKDASHPPLHLLYAADSGDHILFRDELDGWARGDSRFRFETIIAPLSKLDASLLAEIERRWVKADGNRTRHFYICGIGKGILKLRDILRGAGYERRAVHYESW